MKYKVGDRVKIKSLDWYNKNKNKTGFISFDYANFMPEMSRYCGEILTIKQVVEEFESYLVLECGFDWIDEMIEGLAEEEVGLIDVFSSRWVNEFNLPDGYIFKDENGNVINTNKIVLEKKKKEYPKTLRKCCEMLDIDSGCLLSSYDIGLWKDDLLGSLQNLLICRNAYWKMAGEEMGLGKRWEPDWTNQELLKYCIANVGGKIKTSERYIVNTILAFPTEEMRDAFYENFKELIEQCKELL